MPPSGAARLRALQLVGIGINIYPKLSSLFDETLRPKEHQLQAVFEGLAEQAIIGLKLLEAQTGDGWYVNDRLGQADIMAVVCYQASAGFILPDHVHAKSFPHLAALSERAMKIDAFASTVPKSLKS